MRSRCHCRSADLHLCGGEGHHRGGGGGLRSTAEQLQCAAAAGRTAVSFFFEITGGFDRTSCRTLDWGVEEVGGEGMCMRACVCVCV